MAERTGKRRSLTSIVGDDDVKVSSKMGRPILFGYGYRWLSRMGRVCRHTLAAARNRGIPLHDPVVAVAWLLARRGKTDAARAVLVELGYSSTYQVRRRTIVAARPR